MLSCGGTPSAIWRGDNVDREPADLAEAIPMTNVEIACWFLLVAQDKHCKREGSRSYSVCRRKVEAIERV